MPLWQDAPRGAAAAAWAGAAWAGAAAGRAGTAIGLAAAGAGLAGAGAGCADAADESTSDAASVAAIRIRDDVFGIDVFGSRTRKIIHAQRGHAPGGVVKG